MRTKHRAYALIEVLVVIFALVTLIALSVKPMRQAITEAPRTSHVFQTWNVTSKAMEMLKRDVEQCDQILSLQDNILTLRTATGPITYGFDQDRLLRRVGNQADITVWKLLHVQIKTQLWQDNEGKPCALEITTWDQQMVLGKQQTRLKQSYVFFRKGTAEE